MWYLFGFLLGCIGAGVGYSYGAWQGMFLGLLPGGFVMFKAWWAVLGLRYSMTDERLFVRRGVIAKHVEEVELYRVKDVSLAQGVMARLLGIGTIQVLSTDDTTPTLCLEGIPNPESIKEQIRKCYRAARQRERMHAAEFIPS